MKILMVTSVLPHPRALGGGALVMYGQLAALAARHEVTLATFAGADPAEKVALADLRDSGIALHHVWRSWPSGVTLWGRRLRDAMGWIRGGQPLRTLQFFDPSMQYLLDQLLLTQRFDLLQVEDNAMAQYDYRTRTAAVLTEHEVRAALPFHCQAQGKTDWVQQALGEAERRRWQEYQLTVWRRFDRVQVFTSRDAAAIRALDPELGERVRVNPFGIEVPAQINRDREESGTIVFVGGFGHPPNVDAALWLGHEIMPLLRTLWPGIQLIIVGSYPTAAVRALAGQDISVTGCVPAVEPFLERAAIVIAPLRTGGGMRVKVLQAMALGKAVVTTPVGAEGLAVTNGRPPLAIAKSPEEIARVTAALLAAADARGEFGRRARAYVADHCSWSSYVRRLEATYAELQPVGV